MISRTVETACGVFFVAVAVILVLGLPDIAKTIRIHVLVALAAIVLAITGLWLLDRNYIR